MMQWKNYYLDLTLVPLGLLLSILYHGWLWSKVRSQPQHTDFGLNSAARRIWVIAMMKEKSKKEILVVQSIRNAVMGSTVMATASIFLSSGVAAIIGITYNNGEQRIDKAVYGVHGEVVVVVKFAAVLIAFLFSFLFYSLSINFMNQVIFLINLPCSYGDIEDQEDLQYPILAQLEYVCGLLERGFVLHLVANRIFYAGLPLLLWIFGPVLVFLCSILIVSLLYNMDTVQYLGQKTEDN